MADELTQPPAVSLDSVTPQTLSEYTQGKVGANDPRSALLIRGAVAGIRRYCGWHISPSLPENLTLDGSGTRVQKLPSLYVTDVSRVLDQGVQLTLRTDYRWSEKGLLKRTHGLFSPFFRDVEVTFSHGFDDVPDLVALVHSVVARALSSPMGATREQAGSMSVTWSSTTPGAAGGMVLLSSELSTLAPLKL